MAIGKNRSNDLLRRFNNGDIRSYEFVFKMNYNKLCYFANTIVDSKAVSQDIVQDVFVRLWEREKNFESFDKLSAFLYISTRNSCFNFLKHDKFNVAQVDDCVKLCIDDDMMENIISAEILSAINQAISTLPAECKKIMSMVVQGYSSVEIAQLLNLAPSSVRAQKARGIMLLKPKLSRKEFLFLLLLIKF